jgi:hypothetical protein
MDTMLNKPEKPAEKSTPRPLAGRRQVGVPRSAEVGTKKGPAPKAMAVSRAAIHQELDAGEDRFRLIAERAYFRAEARGFKPGKELDDWLAAEIEVDEMLGHAEPRV